MIRCVGLLSESGALLLVGVLDVVWPRVARVFSPEGVRLSGLVDVQLEVVAVRLGEAVLRLRVLVCVTRCVLRKLRLGGPGRAAVRRGAVVDVSARGRV